MPLDDFYTRKRSAKVNSGDLYETPPWATEALLKRHKLVTSRANAHRPTIWEPACGSGKMSHVLERYYGMDNVLSSDIRADSRVYGLKGLDFLKHELQDTRKFDWVITNPPYSHAEDFARRALRVAQEGVALLLKLVFLESQRRKEFFTRFPPKDVYVFRSRVNFYPTDQPEIKGSSGTMAFAWFVWEKGFAGDPAIKWLDDTPGDPA